MQGSSNFCKVFDKLAVVLSQTRECLGIFNCSGDWVLLNGANLLWVWKYSIFGDNMSQVLHFLLAKMTFLSLEFEVGISETLGYQAEVL